MTSPSAPPPWGEAQEAATNEALTMAIGTVIRAEYDKVDAFDGGWRPEAFTLASAVLPVVEPLLLELGSLRRDNQELALKVAVREQAHDAAQTRLAAALQVIEDVNRLALELEADAEQVAGMLAQETKRGRIPNVAMQEAYNADAIAKRHAAQRIRAITGETP
ncbi:MAG: hypothetical protein WB777_14330 [Mycobacterium sp.]